MTDYINPFKICSFWKLLHIVHVLTLYFDVKG